MAASGGGEPPPPPSTEASFRKLLAAQGKKLPPAAPPSFIKKLDSIPEIELPPDHPMRVAISLSDRGLVGKFMGLWPSTRSTDNWIQRNWRPLIQNNVTCYAVGRGFFIFEFISQEDRDLIFRNGPYFMGTQGLYLNRWTPSFDPAVEVPKDVPVWVRLPNLSIHCWNPSSLQAIGNGLGQYIDRADPKDQYSCARICVEVDLEVGLPEAIKLKVGEWQHYQKLDYEQLPFKCRGCHEYDHFQRNCPKNPSKEKEDGEGWQQPRKGRAPAKEKGPRNEKTIPAHSKEQGNWPEAVAENSFRVLEQEHPEKTVVEEPKEAQPIEKKHKKRHPQEPERNQGPKGKRGRERLSLRRREAQTWNQERSPQTVTTRALVTPLSLLKKQAEEGNPRKKKEKMRHTKTSSVARNQQSDN
jgi:hypothetical protein